MIRWRATLEALGWGRARNGSNTFQASGVMKRTASWSSQTGLGEAASRARTPQQYQAVRATGFIQTIWHRPGPGAPGAWHPGVGYVTASGAGNGHDRVRPARPGRGGAGDPSPGYSPFTSEPGMPSRGWILAAGVALVGAAWVAACGGGNGGDVTGPPANTPPTANFGVQCTGLSCTFTDSSSDAEGAIASWQWRFGDDGTATDQNPTHDYAAPGSYSATLTVTDGAGATDSIAKPVDVTAPTAELACTNATAAGTATTCSLTLPAQAAVKAVVTDATTCEATGDLFAFTAPVADTLTTDGCTAPVGTQADVPSSPAGTQVSLEFIGGLTQFSSAVQVTGQYPEWKLAIEDAVGAPFPADFKDLGVTLTVVPGP
jgi:PKD repeat protein